MNNNKDLNIDKKNGALPIEKHSQTGFKHTNVCGPVPFLQRFWQSNNSISSAKTNKRNIYLFVVATIVKIGIIHFSTKQIIYPGAEISMTD